MRIYLHTRRLIAAFILVGALFILLYSVQLRWDGYSNDTPTATLRTNKLSAARLEIGGQAGVGGGKDYCPAVKEYGADIETSELFPTLELNPSWMSRSDSFC